MKKIILLVFLFIFLAGFINLVSAIPCDRDCSPIGYCDTGVGRCMPNECGDNLPCPTRADCANPQCIENEYGGKVCKYGLTPDCLCTSDSDCVLSLPYCTSLKLCMECELDEHCPGDEICVPKSCEDPTKKCMPTGTCYPFCITECPTGFIKEPFDCYLGDCLASTCGKDLDNDKFPNKELLTGRTSCDADLDCDDDSSNDRQEYPNYAFKYNQDGSPNPAYNPNMIWPFPSVIESSILGIKLDKDEDGNIAEHVYPGSEQVYFGENPRVAVPFPDTNCNQPPQVIEAGMQISPELLKLYPLKKHYSDNGFLFEGDEVICNATITDPDEPSTGQIKALIYFIQNYYENEVDHFEQKQAQPQLEFKTCDYKPELKAWYCEAKFRVIYEDSIAHCSIIPEDSKGEENAPEDSISFDVPKYHDFFFYVDPGINDEQVRNSAVEDNWNFLMDKTLMNTGIPPNLAIKMRFIMPKFDLEKYKKLSSQCRALGFIPLRMYDYKEIAMDLETEVEKTLFDNFDPGKDRIVIMSDKIIANHVYCTGESSAAFAVINGWIIVSSLQTDFPAYTHERLHTGSRYDKTPGLTDEYNKRVWEAQAGGPNPFPECCVKTTETCSEGKCLALSGFCVDCKKYGLSCGNPSVHGCINPKNIDTSDMGKSCSNNQGICLASCGDLQPISSTDCASGLNCCKKQTCSNTDTNCASETMYSRYGTCANCKELGDNFECVKELSGSYKCEANGVSVLNCGTWNLCMGFPYENSNTKDSDKIDNPPYGPIFSIMGTPFIGGSAIAIPCETGIPYRDPATWTIFGGTCKIGSSSTSLTGQVISETTSEQPEAANYINESFVIDLIFFPDGKAKIQNTIKENLPPSDNFYLDEAHENVWVIKLLSENKEELDSDKVFTSFYLTDIDIELPESLEYIKLPYSEQARYIEIYYHGNKVAEANINSEQFCNNDNICNNFESYSSCADCQESDLDGVCSQVYNETNGICDPDCLNDLDCQPSTLEQTSLSQLIQTVKQFNNQEITLSNVLSRLQNWLAS